jgi:predicted hotdog family 3-hydroxylacyl-ACP dehydratase
MRDCRYPIASLLPHEHPMILLDQVVAYDDESLIAAVTITDTSLFLRAEGVPGHVGFEYMAQACGAYAGVHALDSGAKVKIGLLLGSRDFRVTVPWYRRGDSLLITVGLNFRDDPMTAFA